LVPTLPYKGVKERPNEWLSWRIYRMKSNIISLITLLVLSVFVQSCARDTKPEISCNFSQSDKSQRISWGKNLPVQMMVHKSIPKKYYSAIESAAKSWNDLMGRELIKIVQWNVSGSTSSVQDGYNLITMSDVWASQKSDEQARTTVYSLGARIVEADIVLNRKNFILSVEAVTPGGAVDFFSLVLHEMGHVLGLAHSTIRGSVMPEGLSSGQNRPLPSPGTGADFKSLSCEY